MSAWLLALLALYVLGIWADAFDTRHLDRSAPRLAQLWLGLTWPITLFCTAYGALLRTLRNAGQR